MRKRIFISLFLTLMIASVVILGFGLGIAYNKYQSRLVEDLNIELNYLTKMDIANVDLDTLSINGRRITLIDKKGKVIFDSMRDSATLENHLDREEVQEALSTGIGFSTRSSSSIGKEYIYQAIRLTDGNILRLSTPANTFMHFVISTFWPYIGCLVLFCIIAFFIASFIAKQITKPINELDLDNPEKNDIYPELTPLVVKINKQQDIIRAQLDDERKRQNEFMLITDNMQEGLVVIAKDGTILAINNATKALFANPRLKINDSVLTISRNLDFSSLVRDCLEGEEKNIKMHVGSRVLDVIANPVLESGAVAGAVLLFLDITEKDEREEMRREFTANVSHELKTPLTVILGFAEMLKNGGLDESSVKEFSSEIYTQARNLTDLVHDTIRLSELDEGANMLDKKPVYLDDVAFKVRDALSTKAKDHSVSLFVDAEHLDIIGNEYLLYELVYNLVDNAIRYNKKDGRVDVSVKKNDKSIDLVVADTGIGIPSDDIGRIFERFYRVDKARSRESGGTGLGLSIVKHVASFHNAQITAESTLGEGTKIKVSFP